MTVGTAISNGVMFVGYAGAEGSLAPDTFTYRTATIGVTALAYSSSFGLSVDIELSSGTTPADGLLGSDNFTLELGTGGTKKSFAINNPGTDKTLDFASPGLSWSSGDTVPVKLLRIVNNLPTSADKTVTATEDTDYTFSSTDFAFTDTDAGAALSSVKIVTLPASGTLTLNTTPVTANQSVPAANLGTLKYAPPANAYGTAVASFTFKVNDGTVDSAVANTLTIDVTAVNDAATGVPGIAGLARVGQALRATVGSIADPDGLPDPFLTDTNTSFQWVRVTSGTDADISGKTASTYTLEAADVGKTIKVKVSFQDAGGGNVGPLTSVAYPSSGTVLAAGSETMPPALAMTDPAVLAANGRTLTLTYNEALHAGAVPANSAFTVKATPHGGAEATLALASTGGVAVSGSTVVLTLAAPIADDHTGVKVSYTKPGADPVIEDAVGNDAASFTDQAVTNNSVVPRVTIEAVYAEATPGIAEPEFKLTRSNTEGGALTVIFEFTQDAAYSALTQTQYFRRPDEPDTHAFHQVTKPPASTCRAAILPLTLAASDTYVVGSSNTATVAMKMPSSGPPALVEIVLPIRRWSRAGR